jgi:hypothetical protein
MAALEWLDAIEAQAPDTAIGFEGVAPQPLRSQPTDRTSYYIYLQPDDTYLAVVTIKAKTGPMSITYQAGTGPSEQAAKALAQADWDSGKRP